MKKLGMVAGLSAALALTGCTSSQERAEAAMSESLGGQFADYDDMQTYPGGVVCGEFTTIDYFGAVKPKRFIVVGNDAINAPSKTDLAIYCSEDPNAALLETLGIDYDAQAETIDQIMRDYATIETALAGYERDNGYCPATEQTLDALVKPATIGNTPRNFPPGGYLSAIPVDPWGNAYVYDCPPFAGTKTEYKLTSLGADGEEGGEGDAADIKLMHRAYFEHIKNL